MFFYINKKTLSKTLKISFFNAHFLYFIVYYLNIFPFFSFYLFVNEFLPLKNAFNINPLISTL